MASERREKFETSSGIELPNDFNPDNITRSITAEISAHRAISLHPRRRRNMYRGKILDDAAVRRIRDRRGIERPLQISALAGHDRP